MKRPTSKPFKQRDIEFAEGGRGSANKMLPKQAANPQQPGGTAHAAGGSAPGAKFARGGPKNHGYGLALPAAPGRTGPVSGKSR